MRDFHGDCPGHCRLFFGFARDLIDSKARLRAPAECRTSLVIGVQQIRGVRSTEPMSRGGNAPAPVETYMSVGIQAAEQTVRLAVRAGGEIKRVSRPSIA